MIKRVYRVEEQEEYRTAGPTDLIQLLPFPGGNSLYLLKWIIEVLVYGIVHHEMIHISGPSGSCKSSLLEALHRTPQNFKSVCKALGYKCRPLKLYPVEMATFEAPGELFQRRALKNGCTYDEQSVLVKALKSAAHHVNDSYPLIWLREIGRVHSSSVQGGLLNLMTKGAILLPDGTRLDGNGIAWTADSNYQAVSDSTHTLVTLDDALNRRFTVQLTLDYLTAPEETLVLQHLIKEGQL